MPGETIILPDGTTTVLPAAGDEPWDYALNTAVKALNTAAQAKLAANAAGSVQKSANASDMADPAAALANLGGAPRASGTVEGLRRLYIYGNSYTQDNGNASSNYTDRLRGRIQPQKWFNGGTSATSTVDETNGAFGGANFICPGSSGGTAFVSSQPITFPNMPYFGGVVCVDTIRNDAGEDGVSASGGTTAKSRAAFTNHIDALIRLFRAQYRIAGNTVATATTTSGSPTITPTGLVGIAPQLRGMPISGAGIPASTYVGTVTGGNVKLSSSKTAQVDVNATASGSVTVTVTPAKSGTWTSTVNLFCTNGYTTSSVTNGDTTTYSFFLATSANVAWTALAVDNSIGITGSSYSVSVDGGTAITGTTSNQTRRSLAFLNLGYGQMCIPLGTLAAGAHTVVITNTGTTGNYLYDDCLLVESPTPPTVVILKTFPLTSTGYATYVSGGGVGAGTATDLIYDGLLDTVVARFPTDQSVIAPDPKGATILGRTFDPTTMIGSTDGTGVHKNDNGERWTADWLMSVLNVLPPRAGLVRL